MKPFFDFLGGMLTVFFGLSGSKSSHVDSCGHLSSSSSALFRSVDVSMPTVFATPLWPGRLIFRCAEYLLEASRLGADLPVIDNLSANGCSFILCTVLFLDPPHQSRLFPASLQLLSMRHDLGRWKSLVKP